MSDWEQLAGLGVATVYEAAGRAGMIDIPLIQSVPGSRLSAYGDVRAGRQPDGTRRDRADSAGRSACAGDAEPTAVALVGELLATQAKARGAAAVLVDAAVRDVEELASLGLPVWARYVRVRGATKTEIGALNVPVEVGETSIHPGDAIVLDADGAFCVARERLDEVIEKAETRREREAELRARLEAGEMSFDIHGLRGFVEEHSK